MQETENNSHAFDTILKSKLAGAARAMTMECPDLSTLAAFYDHALGAGERERMEAHMVGCARCQAMLAAMARADDDILTRTRAENRFEWTRLLRFAVPAFAAIVAIFVVLKFRNPFEVEKPATEIAMNSPVPAMQMQAGTLSSAHVVEQAASAIPPASAQPPAPPPGSAGNSGFAASPPAQSAPMVLAMKSESEHRMAATQSFGAAIARRSSEAKRAQASEPGIAAPETLAQADVATTPSATAPASGTFTIHSPDGSVIWIVGPHSGIVEASSDGASVLQTSGVKADLTHGSAVSARVCWIVGRSGTILRTKDGGGYWENVTAPTTEDLVHVRAANSHDAVIRTVSGKSYATTDGGQTWQRQ